MQNERRNSVLRVVLKLALVLFDVVTVNFSYFMALVLRFYVNNKFHETAIMYIPMFLKFAPFYSVCCIIVFWLFKLYDGMWKYAGLNDANRLVKANLVTCVIQVAGTLLFIGRMPITYYVLGTVIQFFVVFVSRFSYRFFSMEVSKLSQGKTATIQTAIVGSGEMARMLLRQLESEDGNLLHPVCVVDFRRHENGRLFDGLPVLSGIEGLKTAVEAHRVKTVIVADPILPSETQTEIWEAAKNMGLDVQDCVIYSQSRGERIYLRKLLEYTDGNLVLQLDGNERSFENGEQALAALPGRFLVKSMRAASDSLVIELEKDATVLNNVDDTWVRNYEKETGEEISFF